MECSDKVKTKPIVKISYEKVALILIWAGISIIVLSFISYFFEQINIFGFSKKSAEHLGQMGEYIGGIVGSLWSLAGIILFYEAIRFQRTELIMQREELQYQRAEIMEQTNQYIIQNQTLVTSKLEGTYFQLITMHNDIVRGLTLDFDLHNKIEYAAKIVHGRYCFLNYYKYFKKVFNDNIDLTGVSADEPDDIKEILNESFKMFYDEFQEDVGHYFRNLFNLALYIDKSKMNNKKFYYNLVRSLLSNYELIMLFYYCLSEHGQKMKNLTEKYSLFVQLPESELLDRRHKNLFDNKAFEEEFEISLDEASNISLRRMNKEEE